MDTRNPVSAGEQLEAVFDTQKLHVFDKQTEQALI